MRPAVALLFAIALSSSAADAYGNLYLGNGNTGFGGAVGNGSLTVTNDASNLYFTYTRGSGDFNDAFVLYLDHTGGGFTNTSSFTDTADDLRKAISGKDGSNHPVVNFASGMSADAAIALDKNFGGLWFLSSGSHAFQNSVGLSPTGTNNAASYSFSTSLSSLGLAPGSTIKFVGTYLSNTAYRSDEAFGSGVGSGNPGFSGSITYSNFNSYTVAVPEASAFLFGGVSLIAAGIARKLRSRTDMTT